MKKKVFRIILSISLSAVLLCSVLIGFGGCFRKEFEMEYFKCRRVGNIIELYELTELGKEQEIIIVPEKVRGKTVDILGTTVYYMDGLSSYSNWRSEKLEKIFFTHRVWVPLYPSYFPNIQGIFRIYEPPDGGEGYLGGIDPDGKRFPCFIPNIVYDKNKHNKALPANVSYFYNYTDSFNKGYYWIDNYSYGEKITFTPSDPIRKEYKFCGWYKEEKCNNKWDFSRDTLPPALIDEAGETVYQELKLYAKWDKK